MNKYIAVIIIIACVFIVFSAKALTEYTIDFEKNDEIFIINHNLYKAKTYCFNNNEGDKVVFIEGSGNGVCVSAKFLNLRTKKICDVWCE
jgi:hypothetical protein